MKKNQENETKLLAALVDFNRSPSSKRFSSITSLLDLAGAPSDEQLEEMIVYELLQTPSNFRNLDICHRIMAWVQHLEYFQKIMESYGEKARQKMFSSLTAMYYKQGRQLIKVGEDSDKFFIVLKGEVMVLYIRNSKDIERDNSVIERETLKGMNKLQRIKAREQNANLFRGVPIQSLENYQIFFNSLGVPVFDIENTLSSGQSFGQLGIIYKQKRMAHVMCKSDSLIATIAADKYMRFIAQKEQGSIHNMMLFLQQHFFSGLADLELKEAQRYLYLFTVAERKMNSVICSIKEQVNGFYIIMEGSVALKREESEPLKQQKNVDKCLKYLRDTRKKKLIQYKSLLPGQSFGLDEIMLKYNNQIENIEFNYAVVTTSNSKLLFCPMSKIVKLLRTDKNLTQELNQRVNKLRNWTLVQPHTFRNRPSLDERALVTTETARHNFPQRHQIQLETRHLSAIRSSNHFVVNRRAHRYTDLSALGNYVFEPHANTVKMSSRSRADQSFGLTLEDSRVLTESLRRRLRENEQNLIAVLRDCRQIKLKRTCRTAKSRLRCE